MTDFGDAYVYRNRDTRNTTDPENQYGEMTGWYAYGACFHSQDHGAAA